MKTTTLKFPSFIYLTAFRKYSKAKHWEINISDLTVQCDCSEKETGFACNDFRAVVINAAELQAEKAVLQNQAWERAASPLRLVPSA